jgi:glycogen(starch) synthase
MKILVISNLYPQHGIGGYEERCFNTVDNLKKRGHDVHVLTSNHTVDGRPSVEDPDVTRKLRVHGFYGHPWLSIHDLYDLEKENQQTLSATIAAVRPDVIHVWNMGGISKSLLHTLEALPIPLVYDISDHWIARSLKADVWLSWWNDPGSLKRKLLRKLSESTGIRKLAHKQVPTSSVRELKFKNIYFCSEFMRDLTAEQGYPVDHADIVYCGVEHELFIQKTEFQPPRKFIWVGRLAEDKDPMTTIRGFLMARKQSGLPLCLDVYGRGDADYVEQLEAEIKKNDTEGAIRIRSATHEEMRQLYSNYDAYIFSSNWGEPFALTPLEAMSANLPVLMCPDGGDAELLEDGVNALQFVAGSPDSLSQAILRLLEMNDYGEQMTQSARQQVEQCYTIDSMTQKIESILLRAASEQ